MRAVIAAAVLFVGCNLIARKPDDSIAAKDIQAYLDRQIGRGSERAQVTRVEKVNGWDTTIDGTPAYVLLGRVHVKIGNIDRSSFDAFAAGTWLSELSAEPGATVTTRPIEWVYLKTDNGWTFGGLSEAERLKERLAAAAKSADQSRSQRTMQQMCRIARAWEGFATDHNSYVVTKDNDDRMPRGTVLREALRRYGYIDLEDAWGNPFVFETRERGQWYVITSFAADAARGPEIEGASANSAADITYTNGVFIRWRDGTDYLCHD